MKAVLSAIALAAMVLSGPAALAQSSNTIPPPNLTGPKPDLGGVPPAPVGHRQPRAADVPQTSSQADMDAADRALDRKIRSICRGC